MYKTLVMDVAFKSSVDGELPEVDVACASFVEEDVALYVGIHPTIHMHQIILGTLMRCISDKHIGRCMLVQSIDDTLT